MGNLGAFHHSITLQSFIVFSLVQFLQQIMSREEMMGAHLSPVDISKAYHILSVGKVIHLSVALKHTSWVVPVARLQFTSRQEHIM